MKFEFDPNKSASNEEKHGIDFVTAQKLWHLPTWRFQLPYEAEIRWAVVGTIEQKYWTVVITYRGATNDIIRIISARRSRKKEEMLYEENI
ncbi:toxin [Bacteroidia bacterium]|nr:toxin [Bacteroidia bacterium]